MIECNPNPLGWCLSWLPWIMVFLQVNPPPSRSGFPGACAEVLSKALRQLDPPWRGWVFPVLWCISQEIWGLRESWKHHVHSGIFDILCCFFLRCDLDPPRPESERVQKPLNPQTCSSMIKHRTISDLDCPYFLKKRIDVNLPDIVLSAWSQNGICHMEKWWKIVCGIVHQNMELQKKETNWRLKTNKPYGLTNTCGIHQSKSYFSWSHRSDCCASAWLGGHQVSHCWAFQASCFKKCWKNHQRCWFQ